jgi:hypothetical protein
MRVKIPSLIIVLIIAAFPCFAQNYKGDGGLGITINVALPESAELAQGDEFILPFIQSVLIKDFKQFSAIEARDPAAVDALSVAYEAGEALDISNLSNAQYRLSGKLTKSSKQYILARTLIDIAKATTVTSYLKHDIDARNILDTTAINTAFAEIITYWKIELTEAGLKKLNAPDLQEVRAAQDMARGNIAEKNGNPIERLNYLYNSVSYDPSLSQAAEAIESLTAQLSSGDSGSVIRNDKTARDNWKQILDEFESFYSEHPPFEVTYVPIPRQKGKTNYDEGTAVLEFDVTFQESVSFSSMQKVLTTIVHGLKQTGNQEQWRFANWPYTSKIFNRFRDYKLVAELVNNRDEVIDTLNTSVSGRLFAARYTLYADSTQKTALSFSPSHIENEITENMLVRIVSIDGIDVEAAQQNGFVKVTPAEVLPKNKLRNPFMLITKDTFNIH